MSTFKPIIVAEVKKPIVENESENTDFNQKISIRRSFHGNLDIIEVNENASQIVDADVAVKRPFRQDTPLPPIPSNSPNVKKEVKDFSASRESTSSNDTNANNSLSDNGLQKVEIRQKHSFSAAENDLAGVKNKSATPEQKNGKIEETEKNDDEPREKKSSIPSVITVKQAILNKGIQEVTMLKDAKGKLGLKVKNIKKGIYAMEVVKNSPTANAGIFPGDRILKINDIKVDGYNEEQMHKLFKKLPQDQPIHMIVNIRPLEKVFTFTRSSNVRIGFSLRGTRIHSIVKDSPAAIQGLSDEFYIVEVNRKPVRGMKESEIHKLIEESQSQVQITVMPYYIYEPLFKQMPFR